MKLTINIANSKHDGAPVIPIEPPSPRYNPAFFLQVPLAPVIQMVNDARLERTLEIEALTRGRDKVDIKRRKSL